MRPRGLSGASCVQCGSWMVLIAMATGECPQMYEACIYVRFRKRRQSTKGCWEKPVHMTGTKAFTTCVAWEGYIIWESPFSHLKKFERIVSCKV